MEDRMADNARYNERDYADDSSKSTKNRNYFIVIGLHDYSSEIGVLKKAWWCCLLFLPLKAFIKMPSMSQVSDKL